MILDKSEGNARILQLYGMYSTLFITITLSSTLSQNGITW